MKKLILVALVVSILGTSIAYASKIGDILGSYKGVNVYYNGPAGNPRFPYQCVELIKRFFKERYKIDTSKWYGNAGQYFGTAKAKGLTPSPNGGSEPPSEDDILAFGGTYYGHVAIVTGVDDHYVYFVQQNAYPWRDKLPIVNNGGKFTVKNYGSLHVQGWLRLPEEKRPPVSERYLLTFHSIGGLHLGDSMEKAVSIFGEPKEKRPEGTPLANDKPLVEAGPDWTMERWDYDDIWLYFATFPKSRLVFFSTSSKEYKTYKEVSVGSRIEELLREYPGAKESWGVTHSFSYYDNGRIASFSVSDQKPEIWYIEIGLTDYAPGE